MAKQMAAKEGIMVGPSAGAAIKVCRALPPDAQAVPFSCRIPSETPSLIVLKPARHVPKWATRHLVHRRTTQVALDVACRSDQSGKTIVVVVPSHGIRYTAHPLWTEVKEEAQKALPSPPVSDKDAPILQWDSSNP